QRCNEMCTLVGKREPAWLEYVPGQKVAGQRKPVADVAAGGDGLGLAEERRQTQHLVRPWLTRLTRHGASRFRRDVNKIAGGTCCRALCQIEAEAELRQKL